MSLQFLCALRVLARPFIDPRVSADLRLAQGECCRNGEPTLQILWSGSCRCCILGLIALTFVEPVEEAAFVI